MSSLPPASVGITDDQISAFEAAVEFWRRESERFGVEFEWFSPRRWAPNEVIIGNGMDTGFAIRPAPGGYEVVMSREREGDQAPSFYSRYEDAVKRIARMLGRSFRMRALADNSLLTWRDVVAAGVIREDVSDGWARYTLASDPKVYCVIGSYDGDEFSPALTMSIDEFNQAILNDPGVVPPGRR